MPAKLRISIVLTILQLLVSPSVLFSQTSPKEPAGQPITQPKNIILMIGDGMGLNQIYYAMDSVLRRSSSTVDFNILRFRNLALVKTNSANNKVTDSAAAGTAIATGTKTNNKSLGLDVNKKPLKSILKYAEENGLATGLVVTCNVTHATPAAFVANVQHRDSLEEIAKQFLLTDIDVFIGGGYNTFANRKDKVNYIDSLKAHNYHVVTSPEELAKAKLKGKLAGLLYPGHAPKVSAGRGDMLSASLVSALEILKQDKDGFFLMVEGSQIDFAGHDNDTKNSVAELIDFDKAVGIALDYATVHPETLVIVTADHETGGLSLITNNEVKGEMKTNFSTSDHSAALVPLFASGPGAERFYGFMDNTDIFKIMMSLYNFKY